MRELRHRNVLPLLASFTAGQYIWMVSPYYAAGSLQSIIEYAYPQVNAVHDCLFQAEDSSPSTRRRMRIAVLARTRAMTNLAFVNGRY